MELDVFTAVSENKIPWLKEYLASGGDADAQDDDSDPVIFTAIDTDNMEALLLLLSYNANVDITYHEKHFTALQRAIIMDQETFVHVLLIHGANPNKQTIKGNNALHVAVRYGAPQFIPLLLLYGADMGMKNIKDKTPLEYAIFKESTECIDVLQKFSSIEYANLTQNSSLASSRKRKRKHNLSDCTSELVEKRKKIDHQIKELKNQKTEVILSIEKEEQQKVTIEMAKWKENVQIDHKELKELLENVSRVQQNLVESSNSLFKITTTLVNHDAKILMLNKSLNKSITAAVDDSDNEGDYECPICLQIPFPPQSIYQCHEGHIYCGTCKEKPNMEKCPHCRRSIKDVNIRNRLMEKMIARRFKL